MRNIFVIAKNTLKLEIRDRIFYGIIAIAILYLFFTLFLSDLVLKELPMVKSFGLTGIYFFNAIVAIFLGTTSLYRDIERKIVYFIFPKPVSRGQFILGKFFGLCAILLVTSVILGIGYLSLVAYEGGGFDGFGLLAIAMQFFEMALFLSFAVFVSTFSSSLLSIVYTSGAFFAGHIVSAVLTAAKQTGISGIRYVLLEILYYIFPNLEKFDARNLAIHSVATPALSFFLAAAYAAIYIIFLLTAAIWIFEKKEI